MTLEQLRSDEFREQLKPMAECMGALAECGIKWGWDEEVFTKLARLMWRKERDGQIPTDLNDGAGEERR